MLIYLLALAAFYCGIECGEIRGRSSVYWATGLTLDALKDGKEEGEQVGEVDRGVVSGGVDKEGGENRVVTIQLE